MKTYMQFVKGVYGHKSFSLLSIREDGYGSSLRVAGDKPWAGGKVQEALRIHDPDHLIENIGRHFRYNPGAISHPSVFEKAEMYDKIRGRKKKTLKDLADFFGVPVALNSDGELLGFSREPYLEEWSEDDPFLYWDLTYQVFSISDCKEFLEYEGVWESSLTIPDGWGKGVEEKE